jgi:hypothetical protein
MVSFSLDPIPTCSISLPCFVSTVGVRIRVVNQALPDDRQVSIKKWLILNTLRPGKRAFQPASRSSRVRSPN